MAEAKKLGGAGLRGQVAGETALCTVGKSGAGLTYRGYDIADLAEHAQFEEIAYLLLRGKLPNRQELDAYKKKLQSLRGLPAALKTVLEQIPKDAHPMDVMRTGCSMLGNRFSSHASPRALNMGPAFFPMHASAPLFHSCLHQVLLHTIRRAVLLVVLLGECSRLLFSMQHQRC